MVKQISCDICKYMEKETTMAATESQDIILYGPRLSPYLAILTVLSLSLGLALPILARWQVTALLCSLFLIVAGLWFGPVTTWKRIHYPVLMINAQGIRSQSQLLRWEEIDAIYRIDTRRGGVFAVDISPAGYVAFLARQSKRLPKSRNLTGLQLALGIPVARLPIPVDELLAQIRERFADQLERYHIECPVY